MYKPANAYIVFEVEPKLLNSTFKKLKHHLFVK